MLLLEKNELSLSYNRNNKRALDYLLCCYVFLRSIAELFHPVTMGYWISGVKPRLFARKNVKLKTGTSPLNPVSPIIFPSVCSFKTTRVLMFFVYIPAQSPGRTFNDVPVGATYSGQRLSRIVGGILVKWWWVRRVVLHEGNRGALPLVFAVTSWWCYLAAREGIVCCPSPPAMQK